MQRQLLRRDQLAKLLLRLLLLLGMANPLRLNVCNLRRPHQLSRLRRQLHQQLHVLRSHPESAHLVVRFRRLQVVVDQSHHLQVALVAHRVLVVHQSVVVQVVLVLVALLVPALVLVLVVSLQVLSVAVLSERVDHCVQLVQEHADLVVPVLVAQVARVALVVQVLVARVVALVVPVVVLVVVVRVVVQVAQVAVVLVVAQVAVVPVVVLVVVEVANVVYRKKSHVLVVVRILMKCCHRRLRHTRKAMRLYLRASSSLSVVLRHKSLHPNSIAHLQMSFAISWSTAKWLQQP